MRILEDIMDDMDARRSLTVDGVTPDDLLWSSEQFDVSGYNVLMELKFSSGFEPSDVIEKIRVIDDVLTGTSAISSHSYFYISEENPNDAFVGLNFTNCNYRRALKTLERIYNCTQYFNTSKQYIVIMFFDTRERDSELVSKFDYMDMTSIIREIKVADSIDSKPFMNLFKICSLMCGREDKEMFLKDIKWMQKKFRDEFNNRQKAFLNLLRQK